MPRADTTVYAKTPAGQLEIQTRSLGLTLMARRLLVLVDGKRTTEDLAAFGAGHGVDALLAILVEHGCIARVARSEPEPPAAPAPAPAPQAAPAPGARSAAAPAAASSLDALPPAEHRTTEQVDMARNFMINTINRMLEQNSRLTLTKAIFESRNAAELRTHFEAWESAISASWMGSMRLPELRKKLFEVL